MCVCVCVCVCVCLNRAGYRSFWVQAKVNVYFYISECFAFLNSFNLDYINVRSLKVYDNPASGKSIDAIFPTAFAHSVVLVILETFQTSLSLNLLWWSMVSDLQYHCWNYSGCHIRWSPSLINVTHSDGFSNGHCPSLSLSGPPYSPVYSNTEMRLISLISIRW